MAGEQLLYNRPLPGARVNMAHTLAKGLVGCWLLNENGGMRAMDASPHNNHGTLVGFTDPPRRPFNGQSYDGTATYINVGLPTSLSPTTAITMEAWFKAFSIGNGPALISKWYDGGATRGYLLQVVSTGDIKIGVNSGSELLSDTGEVVVDTWYHAVGTYDSNTMRIYKNGSQIKSAAATGGLSLMNENTNIGRDPNPGGAYFTGLIALVRIYGRALSAEEVKAFYISPYKPMGLPLFF